MQNHLKDQTSPYLLQHAENPVNWYPWCEEAFIRAKAEDKPIFLSIGYSTCHWCHVMAHESFEDEEIAEILKQNFISIKVDREERPDIDSIYMAVCQMLTGSGGWPTTIFMTPEQKPFFAGTYFPKNARYGQMGFQHLLLTIHEKWKQNRNELLKSADRIVYYLKGQNGERAADKDWDKTGKGATAFSEKGEEKNKNIGIQLMDTAFKLYHHTFDEKYGGFGRAPKFPTPHNLLFLMQYHEKAQNKEALKMVEKTLLQMYRGGMFDHIGGGFSRYSTDDYFLAPHFEKMLYDNGLLIIAYCRAYQITKNSLYCQIAEKTAKYILREMTSREGGFYSAQDADSEGVEGKYYLFEPDEIIEVLGKKTGEEFNAYFDITERGNFEGKNIPNLLKTKQFSKDFESCLPALYEYRKRRYRLHLDDKILTAWNGLMIAAMCHLYRVTGNKTYRNAAVKAQNFVETNLCEKDFLSLYVSYRSGKHSGKGFLDDYASEIFALLALYEASLEQKYLEKARKLCEKAVSDFYDEKNGGFFLYGEENEQLISRPKETYDGAIPSGNSIMTYNLVRLYLLTGEERFEKLAEEQLQFMSGEAENYPAGYAMFLMALSDYMDLPEKITVVLKEREGRKEEERNLQDLEEEKLTDLSCKVSLSSVITVLEKSNKEYPLKDEKTTFYVCREHSCLPPVNDLDEYFN